MGSPWARLRLPGAPGGAILGAALQALSPEGAGTPLAVTGSQELSQERALSQVLGVQTRDPQADVGSGPWLEEQALCEV